MTTIRKMLVGDFQSVREVDALAFAALNAQTSGAVQSGPLRTHANLLAIWEMDPDGCFLCELDRRVVGFIFSRTWGTLGWFGTFAVLPEFQGRGIGKQLIDASLEYLRQDPGRLIGLETRPEVPYNLGLYLGLGFQTHSLTYVLCKTLGEAHATNDTVFAWSSATASLRGQWLRDLCEAFDGIRPGLDYTREVTSTHRHGFGESLIQCTSSKAIGMSSVWLADTHEGEDQKIANALIMALHPSFTDTGSFGALLEATENLTIAHGKRELHLGVDGRHYWALTQLLSRGYRIGRSMVRMVLPPQENTTVYDPLVDLTRWAA